MVNRWTQVWLSVATAAALFASVNLGVFAYMPDLSFRSEVLVNGVIAGGLFLFALFILRFLVPSAVNAFLFVGTAFFIQSMSFPDAFATISPFASVEQGDVEFMFFSSTVAWAGLLFVNWLVAKNSTPNKQS